MASCLGWCEGTPRYYFNTYHYSNLRGDELVSCLDARPSLTLRKLNVLSAAALNPPRFCALSLWQLWSSLNRCFMQTSTSHEEQRYRVISVRRCRAKNIFKVWGEWVNTPSTSTIVGAQKAHSFAACDGTDFPLPCRSPLLAKIGRAHILMSQFHSSFTFKVGLNMHANAK